MEEEENGWYEDTLFSGASRSEDKAVNEDGRKLILSVKL
jgi:hypothetical protein